MVITGLANSIKKGDYISLLSLGQILKVFFISTMPFDALQPQSQYWFLVPSASPFSQ